MASFAQDERPARNSAAIEALRRAETLLRQDRFQEAAEQLGKEEPARDLPIFTRLTWYWLAGWAWNMCGHSEESIRILKQGMALAADLHSSVPQAQQQKLLQMAEWLRSFLGVAYCSEERTEEALIIQRQCK